MGTQLKESQQIPRFYTKSVNIVLDRDHIRVGASCKGCSNFILKEYVITFRATLIRKFKENLENTLMYRFPAILNKKLMIYYPLSREVSEGVSFSFATVGE